MATFKIPNSQGQTRLDNRSDTRGELWETFNVDLSSTIGKINASKSMQRILEKDTDLGSSDVYALTVFSHPIAGTFYYLATGDDIYRCSVDNDPTDSSNWAEDTDTPSTDPSTDFAVFDGELIVSRDNEIGTYDGNGTRDNTWWTTTISGTALTSDVPHMLHTHRGGQETLFVTDDNKVRYYNSTAGHSTVTLQEGLVASCLDSGVNATWVGTFSKNSESAYVYEIYVGEQISSTPIARNAYKINANAVLGIQVVQNVPYIFTSNGSIEAFNGAGFQKVQQLPVGSDSVNFSGVEVGQVLNSSVRRPLHPRGMQARDNSIYLMVNTRLSDGNTPAISTADFPERCPAGVWDYNVLTGNLNHRYSVADRAQDFGAKKINQSGPLLLVGNTYTDILVGAGVEDADTGLYGNASNTPLWYFVTPEIESASVRDAFERVYLKAKTMQSGEKIQLKYRVTKQDTSFANGTFSDASTINTTDTVTVAVGDEFTISSGLNEGNITHVSKVETSSSVTTIHLTDAIGTTDETIDFEVINFQLIGNDYDADDGEIKSIGINQTVPWIQYKVVGRGDIELREFISKSNNKSGV